MRAIGYFGELRRRTNVRPPSTMRQGAKSKGFICLGRLADESQSWWQALANSAKRPAVVALGSGFSSLGAQILAEPSPLPSALFDHRLDRAAIAPAARNDLAGVERQFEIAARA